MTVPPITLVDRIEYRVAALPGWVTRTPPSGHPVYEGWMRFADGREPDLLSLPLFVDAVAPAALELDLRRMTTVELTVHLRARPAPGWLAFRTLTRFLADGYFEEDAELWDSGRAPGRPVPPARAGAALGAGRVIEAVVFDVDGVLIDSEPVWERVRRGFTAAHGGRWPDDAQDRMMGMSTGEWSAYMSADFGLPLPPQRVAELVIAADGGASTRRTCRCCRGRSRRCARLAPSCRLAVASSAPKSLIEAVLDASGLRPVFAAAVSSEEVPRGKPAPDVYLEAAARLGVSAAVRAPPSRTPPTGCARPPRPAWRSSRCPARSTRPRPTRSSQARVVLDSLTELTPDGSPPFRVAGLSRRR